MDTLRRVARPYALAGLVAAVGGAVGAIVLRVVDPVPIVPTRFGFSDAALVGFALLGVSFASVGALLVVRRPVNAVGWCMVLIGTGYAVGVLFTALTSSALADGADGIATARITGWLALLFTTVGGVIFGIGLIFPTGRAHSPAWGRLVRIMVVNGLLVLAFLLTQPGKLHLFPTIDNPLGIGPDLAPILGFQLSPVVSALSVLFAPILGASLISRYRMSGEVERQQLKWFVLALLLTLAAVGAAGLAGALSDRPPEASLALFGVAGALVPIAIGIAILRHGLYDIDRLISRTLSYAVVTVIVGVVFLAAAMSLGVVLGDLAEGEVIAVAGSTLVVAGVFGPVRRRVQTIVDQRFDRSRYDASLTLQAFAAMLRDDLDLASVQSDVLRVVERTLHPAPSALWIRHRDAPLRDGRPVTRR